MRFMVEFQIEVKASSPEKAATVARDMLLDPSTDIMAEVYQRTWVEGADEWLPDPDHGWTVRFNMPRPGQKPPASPVVPTECIEWVRLKT